MVTFGDLLRDPSRLSDLDANGFLLVAAGSGEVVIDDASSKGDATMVFQHETIAIMRQSAPTN